MQKIHFSTYINAPKETVWNTLWDISNYRLWAAVFCEGSTAVTDNWKEGTKVLFTDNSGSGMVSKVASNQPNEFMSFLHQGEVRNGIEDTTSEAVKAWAGGSENYTLKEENGTTFLAVDLDITEKYKDFFIAIWPKAMDAIKTLAEKGFIPQKITPFLWFNNNVEEAIEFYTRIFKDSKVKKMSRAGEGGALLAATFELNGQEFIALNGGPQFQFSEAVSFLINCNTQEEIDSYWEQLSESGRTDRCGWLKDKFGLSWQVVPTILSKLMSDKNRVKANNVMQAMLKMTKMDVATLQQAYEQE